MKIRFIAPAVVLMFAIGSLIAPAQAQTGWQDKAWLDMRVLAKVGAAETGRANTLIQIQRTCRYLDNGYSALAILNSYSRVASQSAMNVKELNEMTLLGEAIMAVAVTRLCPKHARSVDRALGL